MGRRDPSRSPGARTAASTPWFPIPSRPTGPARPLRRRSPPRLTAPDMATGVSRLDTPVRPHDALPRTRMSRPLSILGWGIRGSPVPAHLWVNIRASTDRSVGLEPDRQRCMVNWVAWRRRPSTSRRSRRPPSHRRGRGSQRGPAHPSRRRRRHGAPPGGRGVGGAVVRRLAGRRVGGARRVDGRARGASARRPAPLGAPRGVRARCPPPPGRSRPPRGAPRAGPRHDRRGAARVSRRAATAHGLRGRPAPRGPLVTRP
jgi:hypothetical protein